MTTGKDRLSQEYKNWLRVTILIDFAGRRLCHDVLFNKEKLPSDGAKLCDKLKPFKQKICQFKNQNEIICPPSGITDYNKFDLTLFTSIIQAMFKSKYDSLVHDLRDARNREFHRGNKELSDIEFNDVWIKTTNMLKKHKFDLTLVDDLKTCNPFSHQLFNFIFQGNREKFLFL